MTCCQTQSLLFGRVNLISSRCSTFSQKTIFSIDNRPYRILWSDFLAKPLQKTNPSQHPLCVNYWWGATTEMTAPLLRPTTWICVYNLLLNNVTTGPIKVFAKRPAWAEWDKITQCEKDPLVWTGSPDMAGSHRTSEPACINATCRIYTL